LTLMTLLNNWLLFLKRVPPVVFFIKK
jgi:hypothetical protein